MPKETVTGQRKLSLDKSCCHSPKESVTGLKANVIADDGLKGLKIGKVNNLKLKRLSYTTMRITETGNKLYVKCNSNHKAAKA
jgi:hypothetical protein